MIELRCRECVPDAMPLVEGGGPAGGGPAGGRLRVAPGAALALACRGSRFLAYPTRDALRATCEAGRWRLQHDGALRHLLELGCQTDPFEDVLHEVRAAPPSYSLPLPALAHLLCHVSSQRS